MKTVYVIGTGTIGLPLIKIFAENKKELGIDEVIFNKNSALETDKSNVVQLLNAGALLATDKEKINDFNKIGIEVAFDKDKALNRSAVVIDCTPKGFGLQNKKEYYLNYSNNERGFIAQGSESGFGIPYAYKINEQAIKDTNFVQVVSCNTHAMARITKCLSDNFDVGMMNFFCVRRSSDVSQDESISPAIKVDKIKDNVFGTHHAKDLSRLYETIGRQLDVASYSIKTNTQYLHSLYFNIEINAETNNTGYDLDEIVKAFHADDMVCVTEKQATNRVFSFGRDFGHCGRLYSQAIISKPSLFYKEIDDRLFRFTGIAFTPQDGNSLLSSVSSALWFVHDRNWDVVNEKMKMFDSYLFQEI